jgi:oligopeptide/dipeptide ABC transporter ATP-binding protein
LTASTHLLEVNNLTTSFRTDDGTITAVDHVSFSVDAGKTLCIVGESGCGKSVTALSVMGLIPASNGTIQPESRILFDGIDLTRLSPEDMRRRRGNELAMIFQEPQTSLNPVYSVGEQIAEVFQIHRGMSKKEGIKAAVEMLNQVKIPAPEQRVHEYPHQLSGGMKQRIVIAMALACLPRLLIADEPSTALDVTVQAQILRLMKELQESTNAAILFITHDLGVVAEIADDVVVMYAGRIVEQGDIFQIFERPKHPYTAALLNSIPKLDTTPKQKLNTIEGIVPSLMNLPRGCRFQDRCPFREQICIDQEPPSLHIGDAHYAACHFAGADAA